MDICRLYPVSSLLFKIQRLWSLETIFRDVPTAKGKQDTLARLKDLRGMLDEVIDELETEIKEEAWLA